ncbi:hypothetical protein ACOMHN_036870 [Nucella lapillus]
MAEVGGKSESKETATVKNHACIHKQMTDAGQFSCAALCALSLQKLFEEEWNRNFNKETLSLILNGLEQPKQVQEAIQAMYTGVGQNDMHPFVDIILKEKVLQGDASPVISQLITIAVSQGNYDARMRALVKHVAWWLHISWDHVEEMECQLAETITAQKYEMSQEEKAEQEKKAKYSKYKRAALIGLATVTGGTLIGLTGGLAAPLVAAGAGAIIGGAGAAALGSVAGVAIIGSLFGVAGAGLTGYKMKKRVGAIEEFEFEPLISGGPLQLQTIRQQLHITIAITGWINSKMPDFKQPWKNLAESQEQYTLRWEPHYLRDLGQALDYIFNSAVSMASHEALKYTVLSTLMAAITWPAALLSVSQVIDNPWTLMAAITWPAALLSVSQVIDNPWSVALQRAVAAGRQLAEVLLSREQGKRPVTLIGYSLGGRVIFYCLEEMAKRKGCEGIVEDVVILGAPVTSDPKAWAAFQRVVAGRIINGFCRGDWLLKFLYRTTSIQLHIAGLAPVKWTNHRMHNIDLSAVVSGHLDYMNQLDTILRVVGIRVRQHIKVTSATSRKPSGFLTPCPSQDTSPEGLSPEVLSPDSNSSSQQADLLQQTGTTNAAKGVESDGKDLGGGLPSVGKGTDQAGTKTDPAGPGSDKSHSKPLKSSRLEDRSDRKLESSSPKEANVSAGEQHREDSNLTAGHRTDQPDRTVQPQENGARQVGQSQSGAGNDCSGNSAPVKKNIGRSITGEDEKEQKCYTAATTEKDGSVRKGSGAAAAAADLAQEDSVEAERVGQEKRKGKEGKEEEQAGESAGTAAAGDVQVKVQGAVRPGVEEDWDDHSYTSSDPDSAPENADTF